MPERVPPDAILIQPSCGSSCSTRAQLCLYAQPHTPLTQMPFSFLARHFARSGFAPVSSSERRTTPVVRRHPPFGASGASWSSTRAQRVPFGQHDRFIRRPSE